MRLTVIVVATLLAGPARAGVGPCDRLLEQGIRSYVGETTEKGFARNAYALLCAAFERASEDKTGAATKEAYAMVGGVGEFDEARFGKLKSAYCTLSKGRQDQQEGLLEAARALRPDAVKAWQRCVDAGKGKYGPAFEVEQADDLTLSVRFDPVRDMRSVQITLDGFMRCSGVLGDHKLVEGAPTSVSIPVLAKNKVQDFACFRRMMRDAPCGTQMVVPASMRIRFEDGKGRIDHHFTMSRVMSGCPLPPQP